MPPSSAPCRFPSSVSAVVVVQSWPSPVSCSLVSPHTIAFVDFPHAVLAFLHATSEPSWSGGDRLWLGGARRRRPRIVNRLRSYRWIEGITQSQLAETLGISTQLVSAIESGQRSPTCDLSRLGYAQHTLELAEMTEPLHRQRADTPVSSKRRAKELLRLAGEAFIGVCDAIPGPTECRLVPVGAPRSDDEAAALAREVRIDALGEDSRGPINDLTQAIEQAGVCLVPLNGLAGVDGLSSWVGDQPVVGLSVDVPGDRFRFSLAHEIGHLVLHTTERPTSAKSKVFEQEANRFASALLMPDDEFNAAMPQRPVLRDFIALKQDWGLSVAALVYRAHLLGHLDDRAYRSIQIQMSRWRKNEPAAMRPVFGRRFPRLVEQAGGPRVCAQRLGVNEGHLRQLVTWPRLGTA